MSEAATPAENNGGTPPTPPAATPAASATDTVSLSKEAHDQLARDAARASGNQRKADLYDKMVGKGGGSHFTPRVPVTPPTPEEQASADAAEDRKAERGLLALAADPSLREILDADPTLRDLLTKNPMAVLPMFAPDALDADDAIALVKDVLQKRAKPATPPVTPPPAGSPVTPPAPPTGGVNPQDREVDAEYEQARKHPNTEAAIAGMVKTGMKRMKK